MFAEGKMSIYHMSDSNSVGNDLLEPVQKLEHAGLWYAFEGCIIDMLQPELRNASREPLEVIDWMLVRQRMKSSMR